MLRWLLAGSSELLPTYWNNAYSTNGEEKQICRRLRYDRKPIRSFCDAESLFMLWFNWLVLRECSLASQCKILRTGREQNTAWTAPCDVRGKWNMTVRRKKRSEGSVAGDTRFLKVRFFRDHAAFARERKQNASHGLHRVDGKRWWLCCLSLSVRCGRCGEAVIVCAMLSLWCMNTFFA